MRKLLAVLFLFCGLIVKGQVVPQGINYQAVALDQQGQPIPGVDIVGRPIDDAEIGVRISILEASPTGNVLYQEEHEVLTDQYGMFNLTIGQGLQVSADAFNTINWQGDKFLQVELSIENDGEFTLSAVQQLMSVPYAFLADRALNVDDADADPSNELQALSISNDTLYLSSGGFVVLPSDQINDADADPTNELQVISMSNDTLYLSSGGFVVLPPDQINDADADPTNEFQTITRNGSTINLSGNGGSVTVFDGDYTNLTNTPTIPSKTSDLFNDSGFLTSEFDGSTTNEIQTLSKSGSTISLSDNGGSVTVFDGDYNDLSNTPSIPTSTSDLSNDSGFLTSEVDGSTTNEIQTLSKSGSTISLSDNGGSVTVFDGDYNNLSNTPSIPTSTSDLTNDSGFLTSEVDGSTTNELQVLSISNDTIFLSDGGFIKLPASQGFDGDYNSLTNTPSIPTLTSDLTNDSGFLTSEVDGSTTNEIQILSISNDTIFLSDGGFIKLPASQGFDGDYNSLTNTPSIPTLTSELTNDSGFLTSEVDGSTTNEIQTLSKSGSTISLSDNGGSITVFDGDYNNLSNTPTIPTSTSDLVNNSGFLTSEVDGSTTNEIQTLSKSGSTISLSDNGGSVTVFDGDYNNLSNTPTIPISTSDLINDSGFLTSEVDSSTTNEIQTISISNDTIFLSNGGYVKLPQSANNPGSNTQGGFYDWIYEAGGSFVGSVHSTNTSDSSRIDLYDKAGYMRLKGDFYSGSSGNYVFDITCVITDDSGNVLYQQNHSNGSGFELNRKLDGSISFITIKLTWNSGNSNGWLRKEYSELLLFEDSATNTASPSSSKANSIIYTINGF